MPNMESGTDTVAHLSKIVNRLVEFLCAAIFGVMTLIVLVGVFFRYVLNAPLNWVEEMSRYLMIWGASLGISLGVTAGEHVGITTLFEAIKSRKAKNALLIIVNLIVLAFLVFMFGYSLKTVVEAKAQMTMSLGIDMVLPRLAIPVAMALAAIQIVLTTILAIRGQGARVEARGYIDI